MEIPLVDLAPIFQKECSVSSKKYVADRLHQAFMDIGFAYLTSHGIPRQLITDVIEASDVFFKLPVEIKQRYSRKGNEGNFGWIASESEILNPGRPYADLKELLDYNKGFGADDFAEHAPTLQPAAEKMSRSCENLAHTILELMAIGQGLDDSKYFCKRHHFEDASNRTTLRLLYYPAITSSSVKSGQVRAGEHSDIGSITLLIQDDIGGLEVLSRKNGYVPATPIPDTVLVNIGDIMQRWTSDKLISTTHRVLIPEDEKRMRNVRRSIAFFANPDDGHLVECLDGSGKYEPITSLEYMNMRLNAAHQF